MSDIGSVIAAATALVAVVLGPIVSVYVVRRQIRATVVSTNRQAWINDLRNTIADWLTAEQLTLRETAELCVTIAEALHHAHENGVVHRDLKPSNIMLEKVESPESRARLVRVPDFRLWTLNSRLHASHHGLRAGQARSGRDYNDRRRQGARHTSLHVA